MLTPLLANIPRELRQYPQWVMWRMGTRKDGKPTKPPYQPNGKLAESNNPETWSPFSVVAEAAPRYDGTGFVLSESDPFVGVDFDECRCPAFDLILPDVAGQIKRLNSYTEISPSGRGIRVFLKGRIPVDGRKKGNTEVYQNRHYMTVTGHVLDGYPCTIETRQAEVDSFFKSVFESPDSPPEKDKDQEEKPQRDNTPFDWKDRLEKAFQSKRGEEIKRLWDGDISGYNSHSEADLALCSHLSFWLSGDRRAVDEVFRKSGLYRDKWDKKHHSDGRTYGQATIDQAVAGCQSFYDDGKSVVVTSPCTETPEIMTQGSGKNTLDAAIQRLAALPPLQYEQLRKGEAKALNVRTVILDAEVKAARKGDYAGALPFEEVKSWAEPVDPAKLLTDISATVRRFIICSEEMSHAVALWVAMTWFIDVVQVAPLAVITAPEKRCGKTLLLSLLGQLSARAITASNISPAALFRSIDAWKPTLLIDEADSFMKDNEEMRGLLNSGHTRESAYVVRTVGDNFTPTKFNTWGAKALAGIGHVADTLMDRAIILELRRKLPHEGVERIRYAEPNPFPDLRAKLARFAEDYSDQVRQARPPLPSALNDRAQDNWEPLLAIAMTASGEWLQIGTTAALKLSGGESASRTIGTELLADIRTIFEEKQVDRISTAELINDLCADDEKPWATYKKGFPIDPRRLASKLKGYGVSSKTIRFSSGLAKGYEKDQFAEAFSRYVPLYSVSSVTTLQHSIVNDLGNFSNVTRGDAVTYRNQRNPSSELDCYDVTDKNPLTGLREENILNLPASDLREVTL